MTDEARSGHVGPAPPVAHDAPNIDRLVVFLDGPTVDTHYRYRYRDTDISPSSDQPSCGIVKFTILGVSARCGGSVSCALRKWSD